MKTVSIIAVLSAVAAVTLHVAADVSFPAEKFEGTNGFLGE